VKNNSKIIFDLIVLVVQLCFMLLSAAAVVVCKLGFGMRLAVFAVTRRIFSAWNFANASETGRVILAGLGLSLPGVALVVWLFTRR